MSSRGRRSTTTSTSRSRSRSSSPGSTSGSAGGRGKRWYQVFTPLDDAIIGDPWDVYSSKNLDEFIKAAGAQEQFEREVTNGSQIALRNEFKRQLLGPGEPLPAPGSEADKALNIRISQSRVKGGYTDKSMQLKYNFVKKLYDQGKLNNVVIPEATTGGSTQVDLTMVVQQWKKLGADQDGAEGVKGRADFITWIANTQVDRFQIKALDQAAALLGVQQRSFVKDVRVSTNPEVNRSAKKKYLKRLILASPIAQEIMGGTYPLSADVSEAPVNIAPAGRATVAPVARRLTTAQAQVPVPTSYRELASMRLQPEMRALARQLNLTGTSNWNKAPLTAEIARVLGLAPAGGAEAAAGRSPAQVLNEIKAITNLGNLEEGFRRAQAISRAEYESLGRGTAKDITTMGKAIQLAKRFPNIFGTPASYTKEKVIQAVTGEQGAGDLSLSRRRAVAAGGSACATASMFEVQQAAKEQNISTLGKSQSDLCSELEMKNMETFSEAFLLNFPQLMIAYRAQGAQRTAELNRLARSLDRANITDIDALVRDWLNAHFLFRAQRFYPDYIGVVRAYLNTGAIPTAQDELRALQGVFGDIEGGLYEPGADLGGLLSDLHGRFIGPIQAGGARGLAAIERNIGNLAFVRRGAGTRFARSPVAMGGTTGGRGRSPSPTRRRTSPLTTAEAEASGVGLGATTGARAGTRSPRGTRGTTAFQPEVVFEEEEEILPA